jgi:hypothetical protein
MQAYSATIRPDFRFAGEDIDEPESGTNEIA